MTPARSSRSPPRLASRGTTWAVRPWRRAGSAQRTCRICRKGTGHALVGAPAVIPTGHIDNPVTSRAMGPSTDLVFRTKGQLAIDICAGAFADGLRFRLDLRRRGVRELHHAAGVPGGPRSGKCAAGPGEFPSEAGRRDHHDMRHAAAWLLTDKRRWESRSAGKAPKETAGTRGGWAIDREPRRAGRPCLRRQVLQPALIHSPRTQRLVHYAPAATELQLQVQAHRAPSTRPGAHASASARPDSASP